MREYLGVLTYSRSPRTRVARTWTVQYPFWVLYSPTQLLVCGRIVRELRLHVATCRTVPTRLVRSVGLSNLAGPVLGPGRLLSSRPPRWSSLYTAFSPMINGIRLNRPLVTPPSFWGVT